MDALNGSRRHLRNGVAFFSAISETTELVIICAHALSGEMEKVLNIYCARDGLALRP